MNRSFPAGKRVRLGVLVSANLNRRNLKKGQRALALIYPEPRVDGEIDPAKKR
jgi:hypothetical protein